MPTNEEPEELPEYMKQYVKRFRRRIMDDNPAKNTLNDFQEEYSDEQIAGFVEDSWYLINETEPRSNFNLEKFPKTNLLLDGAMLMMFQGQGLLHLRNQISYSDAGFSVNLDDKSGHYAQWLNNRATVFYQDLTKFKRSLVPRMHGIPSPNRWW